MAKEFKHFDKKYAKFAGTALKDIAMRIGVAAVDIKTLSITHWEFMDQFTEAYSATQIRYAVYEADGAEDWQKFRVSLKGHSCKEKLFALKWYWNWLCAGGPGTHLSVASWEHDVLRVNNYLGALKRGGFLDSQLRVIKN